MIIYADLRSLIVTGIVLYLTNLAWNYPLPLQRKLQQSGKRMIMTKKSCQDSIGTVGTCMFKYDCIRQKGVTLSTCVDGFLFGACCLLKENPVQIIPEDIFSESFYSNEHQAYNNSISDFTQFITSIDSKNSTKYIHTSKEINKTSFLYLSSDDVHFDPSSNSSDLPSTSSDLSRYSKTTSNTPITFSQTVNESTTFYDPVTEEEEITLASSASFLFISKFPATESNSVIKLTESREELETSHESSDALNQDNSKNIRNASKFENSTGIFGTETIESSLQTHLAETRNQFINIGSLESKDKEDDKVTSVGYLETEKNDGNSNMLDENADYEFNSTASSSNSADLGLSLDNYLLKSGNQSIEKNSSADGVSGTNHDQLEIQIYYESTSSPKISSDEISSPNTEIKNKTRQYEISGEEYEHQNENNSKIYDEDFATTSPLKEITVNTFESSTRNLNVEIGNLEISTATPLELLDPSIRFHSTGLEPEEMLNVEQTTTGMDVRNEDIFSPHDIPLKTPSKTIDRFITDSIPTFSGFNSNEKIATKSVPLPTLPWSSHSILPESLQSVISQLTVQEESSPAILNLKIETQVESTIDLNEFSTKNVFSDSEESVKSELQGNGFEIFNSSEESYSEENYTFLEFKQTYNSPESIPYSLNETTPQISTVTPNNTMLKDEDENILLIPNSVSGNLSIYKLSTNFTQVPNDEMFSRVNFNITLHELNQNRTEVHILEHSPNASANEKFEEEITSISILDKLTKPNDFKIEPLKSNTESRWTSHKEESSLSSEIELHTFSNIALRNKTNNLESDNRLTTINPFEQNSVVTPHSVTSVQNSLNSSLFKETEFTDVWTESLELDSFTSTMNSFEINFAEESNSLTPVHRPPSTASLPETTAFVDPWTEDTVPESSTAIIQIINNHVGKNLSAINFSSKVKDANVPHVNTIVFQSENAESKENITIPSIVNNSQYSESNSSLYDATAFIYTPPLAMQSVEDSEGITESVHSIASTVASSIYLVYDESTDSSQNSTLGTTSTSINFNSMSNFSSLSISNSTSLSETPAEAGTESLKVQPMDFEELVEDAGSSTSLAINGNNNTMVIETNTNKHPEVPLYTDINTESSSNVKLDELIVENSSLTDSPLNVQITKEITEVYETLYTTPKEEFSESVTSPALNISVDFENFTTSGVLKPVNTHSSDNFTAFLSTESFSYNTTRPSEVAQHVDVMTDDKLSVNTLHESSNQSVEGLTSVMHPILTTTETTSIDFSSQTGVTTKVDNLTYLSTQTIKTPVSTTVTVSTTHAIRWNYKKDCGVRLMQPIGRIVGGKNTYFGKWPWQALVKEATWLGLFLKNKCGGVLITSKYVLTAAHCQPGFFASLLVVLGTHDLAETFDNKASVIRNVKRMVVHRHYNAQTFENDLALLEMESSVEFLPYVVPICLPHRNEDFTGKMAFVTGWGKLTHGGDVPNILQEVQVPIVTNGDCQRMFFHAGHHKAIRSNFVCAGYSNGGQDSCEGDSGGPLMVQREDKRWVLVGTVSHGIGCADPNLPGVYMRMSSYRPWIDSIIYK